MTDEEMITAYISAPLAVQAAQAPTEAEDLEKSIRQAIFDPGATEGYKDGRSLTQWQTDAVMRVINRRMEVDRDAAVATVMEQAVSVQQDRAEYWAKEADTRKGLERATASARCAGHLSALTAIRAMIPASGGDALKQARIDGMRAAMNLLAESVTKDAALKCIEALIQRGSV